MEALALPETSESSVGDAQYMRFFNMFNKGNHITFRTLDISAQAYFNLECASRDSAFTYIAINSNTQKGTCCLAIKSNG
jgi:hypothetical protein